MGLWNDRKLIVNCLPLTESERAQFTRAAFVRASEAFYAQVSAFAGPFED